MMINYDHWISGKATAPSSGAFIDSTSPVDGRLVARIASGTESDVACAVAAAHDAGHAWRERRPMERGQLLMALGRAIRERADRFIELESAESGKPAWQAELEVEGAAQYCEFYGGLVNIEQGSVLDAGPGTHAFTRREPFGVVGVITPWNSPLNQCLRSSVPALAVGNTVVVKPSEFTSTSTLTVAQLATEIGLDDGVFNVVTGTGSAVGQSLVSHEKVRRVSFTGSVRAGREVGRIAAERIIPVSLELGGKGANLVFADADIDKAVDGSLMAFAYNTGQVCSAGTRLLVERTVHDRVVDALAAKTPSMSNKLGPLTTSAQRDKVAHYLEVAASEGARAVVGGTPGSGNFIEPTIYTGVTNDMRIAREEVFGPVLAVIPFDNQDEAVALANDSDYGLSAGIWTRDISRAHRVAEQLEAGQVYINAWRSSLIETPFGGYKNSGYGREKGLQALHEYTQLKSVIVTYSR
ncbi:aldehyde dehydrogenase family protein [Rhodococcus sp. IEGM 1351]|uniref:aldehyde dehydrogenase family protein n=1 Tax=Rhodococcus sp. IEGM 1351 TaxID=3047089 RepID=UPI0024B64B95|nr:aldehyde dehydrogenase family protein [Rhodococcus sp. IEGM 1351]MDI9941059.1 aldehyde dehydrogenase family protein [Rhodococcus sp. IEGM 1351]